MSSAAPEFTLPQTTISAEFTAQASAVANGEFKFVEASSAPARKLLKARRTVPSVASAVPTHATAFAEAEPQTLTAAQLVRAFTVVFH